MYILRWQGWCRDNRTEFYDSEGETEIEGVDGHNIVRALQTVTGYRRLDYQIYQIIGPDWELKITWHTDSIYKNI